MARSFQDLKRSSGKADLQKLTTELDKLNQPTYDNKDDDRYWKPTVDKAGNGSATIRFLPAPPQDGDDGIPFVRIWDHGFKGPTGKWYIENSLTTIGKDDPCSEYNTELWNISSDDDSPTRKQARDQKRRLHYTSNILVIKDPAKPECNGKVYLYEYGKKIFDKLNDLMNPQFDDLEAVNPFDMFAGADFRLRIRKFEGYRNYDKSDFAEPSPIKGTDEELEAIWNSEYSLLELIDPTDTKRFKSYDELKKKLNQVLGLTGAAAASQPRAEEPAQRTRAAPRNEEVDTDTSTETEVPWTADDSDDEDESYFAKLRQLANED